MGFIETSYGSSPNLSQVNIDSNLNLGPYGITTDGELNINNSDLIGVDQFICKDYLGAVKADASDVLQWTLILNDVMYDDTKKFRVPSNFVNNCSVKVTFYATNTATGAYPVYIRRYENGSYTEVGSVSVPANTTTPTEFTITLSNINAGELYTLRAPASMYLTVLGASGVKISCDLNPVTGGYWDISD